MMIQVGSRILYIFDKFKVFFFIEINLFNLIILYLLGFKIISIKIMINVISYMIIVIKLRIFKINYMIIRID
jgi:hypothetical protein